MKYGNNVFKATYILFAKMLNDIIPVELILLAAILFWSGKIWDVVSYLTQQRYLLQVKQLLLLLASPLQMKTIFTNFGVCLFSFVFFSHYF